MDRHTDFGELLDDFRDGHHLDLLHDALHGPFLESTLRHRNDCFAALRETPWSATLKAAQNIVHDLRKDTTRRNECATVCHTQLH